MDPTHSCELLEYEHQKLELVCPGTQYQRWAYVWEESGQVILQMVLFCPGCGKDLREDTLWQIAGRPVFNEIVRKNNPGHFAEIPKLPDADQRQEVL